MTNVDECAKGDGQTNDSRSSTSASHVETSGRRVGQARRAQALPTFAPPSAQASLSPTAKKLLEAARRVLEQSGYKALSYESVGREAGLSPNLIRYHFGSKAGLLIALTDWLMYDTLWEVWRRLGATPNAEDRIDLLMQDFVGVLSGPQSYMLFYDLLPHLLRDDRMRPRVAQLYEAYIATNVRALSPDPSEQAPSETIRTLAAMTIAIGDGLAIQLLASPDSPNVDLAAALWRDYLEWTLRRLAAATPPEAQSAPSDDSSDPS